MLGEKLRQQNILSQRIHLDKIGESGAGRKTKLGNENRYHLCHPAPNLSPIPAHPKFKISSQPNSLSSCHLIPTRRPDRFPDVNSLVQSEVITE